MVDAKAAPSPSVLPSAVQAELTSPGRRLKRRHSSDRSAPLIECSASARRAVDPSLLEELTSPQRQKATEATEGAVQVERDAEVWIRTVMGHYSP